MKAGTCKRPRFFRLFCSVSFVLARFFRLLLRFFSAFVPFFCRLCSVFFGFVRSFRLLLRSFFRLLLRSFFAFLPRFFSAFSPFHFCLLLRSFLLCPLLSALPVPFFVFCSVSFRLFLPRSFSHFVPFRSPFAPFFCRLCSVSFRLLFRFFRSFLSAGKYAPNGKKRPLSEPTFIVKKQLCFSPQKNIAEVQQFGATASHIDEQRQKEKAS